MEVPLLVLRLAGANEYSVLSSLPISENEVLLQEDFCP